MTRIFALLAVILLLPVLTGATVPTVRQAHRPPDAAFFLANNGDVYGALQSYAEALCLQDKMEDLLPSVSRHTPNAILAAGAICQDSKRNADGDSLSRDGQWRSYSMAAYDEIVALCQREGQGYDVCRWFK